MNREDRVEKEQGQTPAAPTSRWEGGALQRRLASRQMRHHSPALHLVLFIATLITMAAMYVFLPIMWEVGASRSRLSSGIFYSLSLASILGAHEMGHYVACRVYGVRATLPYFLPAPFTLFGTMGAVIRISGRIPHRRALFDIAVAGPLAGLVLALAALAWGLPRSPVVPLDPSLEHLQLGEPLLLRWMIANAVGVVSPGSAISYHPVAFAGWAGLFVTALNLLPAGQLDGGHILYSLWGERTQRVGLVVVVSLVGYSLASGFYGWVLFALFLFFMGLRHPPVGHGGPPLDRGRRGLGIALLILFGFLFTPVPIRFG